MTPMQISATALDVEWQRLELIAQNLANAGSVMGTGTDYRPARLVSGPKVAFSDVAKRASVDPSSLQGVHVVAVMPQDVAPRRIHEPGNPLADSSGYVNYAGVNQTEEMTLMIKTARVYEANVVALNTARQMYGKALDIGRR